MTETSEREIAARTCGECGKVVGMLFYGNCHDCQIDSYDYDEDGEPEDDGLDECAMTSDGYCMLAGTEHCEWECPIVYSSFGRAILQEQV